nr:zf-HC2 domain-containing protein [uncultured Actinoplanes sp.]
MTSRLLGPYVLGVLDADEQAGVRAHLDGCPSCRREVDDLREMETALGEIPPEAFLEGPPPEGDLLLRRTLHQVRDEGRSSSRRRRTMWIAAVVVAGLLALAGGTIAGRLTAPPASPAATTETPVVVPSGARGAAATDARTGATMAVVVRPAAGWVRVHAEVSGVPAGEQCRLFVIGRDGSREAAGSWLVSDDRGGVDGSALMDPAVVAAVQAETYAGQILVSVPV